MDLNKLKKEYMKHNELYIQKFIDRINELEEELLEKELFISELDEEISNKNKFIEQQEIDIMFK